MDEIAEVAKDEEDKKEDEDKKEKDEAKDKKEKEADGEEESECEDPNDVDPGESTNRTVVTFIGTPEAAKEAAASAAAVEGLKTQVTTLEKIAETAEKRLAAAENRTRSKTSK